MKEHIFPENGIYYRMNDFDVTKKTLVFIHGLSGNSSAWEPYERQFIGDYNLLCIDLRGHGCSKKYPKESDYAIGLFVKDIKLLLDRLEIKNYIVISHSFGSVISVGLIETDPGRVKAAIFLAPAFEPKHSFRTKSTLLVSGSMASFLKVFPVSTEQGKRLDYSRFIPTSDWDFRRIWSDIKNTGMAIYFFCLRSLYRSMDDDFYAALHLPVLIIHGQHDSYVSLKHSIDAKNNISGAKLVVLPQADHMLVFNFPTDIIREMKAFLGLIHF